MTIFRGIGIDQSSTIAEYASYRVSLKTLESRNPALHLDPLNPPASVFEVLNVLPVFFCPYIPLMPTFMIGSILCMRPLGHHVKSSRLELSALR